MKRRKLAQVLGIGLAALAVAACAGGDNRPSQPAAPEVDPVTGQPIIEAGDIAIAGQLVSHSIMNLPEVADAQKPPLVQFSGVTSVVNGPVDTSPYTTLLRDRMLLLTREKLRFVERQLPPLTAHKGKHHNAEGGGPLDVDTSADFRIAAQLQGNLNDDNYHIDIRFIDLHSGQPLFDGLYSIRKEKGDDVTGETSITTQEAQPNPRIESTDPMPPDSDSQYQPPPPPISNSSPVLQ